MLRMVMLVIAGVSTVSAAPRATVKDLRAQPAAKVDDKNGAPIGCGLTELGARGLGNPYDAYDPKVLAAAGAKLHAEDPASKPVLQSVWTWCASPGVFVRVWSVCKGHGDSQSCAV